MVILFDQKLPRRSQALVLDPSTESLVNGRFWAVSARQLTPLTAGSGQPDQPIEDRARVPCGTPALFLGLVDHQQGSQTNPEFIRDLPQRGLVINLVLMELGGGHRLLENHIFRTGS